MVASEETHLKYLIAISLLFLRHNYPDFDARLDGSYVAKTLNGRSLPADLRVPVESGDFRLFRLEQGVLRLQSGGRFTLYFRYYHQLVRRGDRPVSTPVMSDSETGSYTIRLNKIVLTPQKKSGAKSRHPISATIAGDEIDATYMLQNGGLSQRVNLVLRRDSSYW
jgi:hypothetical protein